MPQLLTLEGIDDDGDVALCGYSVAELMAGLAGSELQLDSLGALPWTRKRTPSYQLLRPIPPSEKVQVAPAVVLSAKKTKLLWLIPGAIIGAGVFVSSLIWRKALKS